jgi:Cof subfamily protein (haloacid dehalogenase superfamily)
LKDNSESVNLPVFRRTPGAIAIDLDGTLLNSRAQISERNQNAIENCLDRGIPVIIATSRPARSVRRFLGDKLLQDCSLVMQNGAIAKAAPPFSGYFKEALPETLIREIIELILQIESEAHITIEIEGYEFGTNWPRNAAELWERNSATPEMQLPLKSALASIPTKIAVGGLNRDMSRVLDSITRRFHDSISVVPSDGRILLNITSTKATKPEALRKILGSGNITLDDVIAFGDDTPDLEMLQACGTAVAMANAIPEVKAACEYCTFSNDDDGVAIVLEKMLDDTAHLT